MHPPPYFLVGTAVVTGQNGRLAMGRLGALCEQVKKLNFQGYEVILFASSAVGIGRQRLKYRKLINSHVAESFFSQQFTDGHCLWLSSLLVC